MRWLLVIVFCCIAQAQADEIKLYEPKQLIPRVNTHNMEHALKQRLELEGKLLQWNLTEPLRAITRIPNRAIQSIPPINYQSFESPAPPSITPEEKVAEWKVIECQRFKRCD